MCPLKLNLVSLHTLNRERQRQRQTDRQRTNRSTSQTKTAFHSAVKAPLKKRKILLYNKLYTSTTNNNIKTMSYKLHTHTRAHTHAHTHAFARKHPFTHAQRE